MHENTLHDYTIQIPRNQIQTLSSILKDCWAELGFLYSYIVIGKIESIAIKYIVSEITEYNTINWLEASMTILDTISHKKNENSVLCFKQAPIELYIVLYEPMIEKMAKQASAQWPRLEYEDLCQICKLCCVELYQKGYYLHKSLLWTTFKNKILEEVRPLKKRNSTVSLYDRSYDDGKDSSNKNLTIADTLVDMDSIYEEQDAANRDAELLIFEEVKDIIIDLIGPRQFDTLFRDYKNKHTTTTSRKILTKIKSYFASLGLTREDFNNKYH